MPGDGLAAALFFISALLFVIAGYVAGQLTNLEMPALFFVVLLLMLICWGLSGLSFLLDRYRLPVLILFPMTLCVLPALLILFLGPPLFSFLQ